MTRSIAIGADPEWPSNRHLGPDEPISGRTIRLAVSGETVPFQRDALLIGVLCEPRPAIFCRLCVAHPRHRHDATSRSLITSPPLLLAVLTMMLENWSTLSKRPATFTVYWKV